MSGDCSNFGAVHGEGEAFEIFTAADSPVKAHYIARIELNGGGNGACRADMILVAACAAEFIVEHNGNPGIFAFGHEMMPVFNKVHRFVKGCLRFFAAAHINKAHAVYIGAVILADKAAVFAFTGHGVDCEKLAPEADTGSIVAVLHVGVADVALAVLAVVNHGGGPALKPVGMGKLSGAAVRRNANVVAGVEVKAQEFAVADIGNGGNANNVCGRDCGTERTVLAELANLKVAVDNVESVVFPVIGH